MTKYSFILISGDEARFLEKVQELGLLDITRSIKPVDDNSSAMVAEISALRKKISDISNDNFTRDLRYRELCDLLKEAGRERKECLPWGEFDPEKLEGLKERGIGIHFYKTSAKQYDKAWESQYPLDIINEDGKSVWFVTVSREGEAYNFPIAEIQKPQTSINSIDARIASIEMEIRSREKELSEEKKDLPALEKKLEDMVSQLDFYLAKAATGKAAENTLSTYIGFALTENEEKVCAGLDAIDGLYYVCEAATNEDNPPIEFKNNRFVMMFEFFTDMYGRPAYNGFDPTPYIAVFFTLFFGMCMGDAGYGVVIMLAGILLGKTKGSLASSGPLVTVLGLATVVIGLIFHTVFSVDLLTLEGIPESIRAYMLPAKIPGTDYDTTMAIALITGIVHICVALIVKTIYATRNNGLLGSLSVWGWTLFLVGTSVLGALLATGVITSAGFKYAFIAIGILSAIVIYPLRNLKKNPLINIGAGLWETYNTATGLLGDVLSYLRLYALGLAGSMLGLAFNQIAAGVLGEGSIGQWIGFITIVIIGHTLNVAIAALGAFVHPLRLNLLEFFKNSDYEALGTKYNPFKK